MVMASNMSSHFDQESVKTEGIGQDEEDPDGESTGVWTLTNDLHNGPEMPLAKSKQMLQLQAERNYASPQQEALASKIADLQSQLLELYERQNTGKMTEYDVIELDRVSKELKSTKAQLKRKRQNQATQARARDRKRKLFESLDPDTRVKVFGRKELKIGRPSLCDNEELKKAIIEITSGAAINDGRKSDTIRTAISLNQITSELQKRGFNLKRSAVYTRLLPRKASTHEGKRHNNIVPVKLVGTPTNRGTQQNTSALGQNKKAGHVVGPSTAQPPATGGISYSHGQVQGQQDRESTDQNIHLSAFSDQASTIYQQPHDVLKSQPTGSAGISIQHPGIWTTQTVNDAQTIGGTVGETVTVFTTGSVLENQEGMQTQAEPSEGTVDIPIAEALSRSREQSEESNSNVNYSTPKQDALVARIAYLQDQETSYLLTGLTPGMLSEHDARDLSRISKELQTLKAQLRKKQGDQKRQAKARNKKKQLLEQLDPETKLKVFGKLDVGQKKMRKPKEETSSPKKEKKDNPAEDVKVPSMSSRRLRRGKKGHRMKNRNRNLVPVPAYLYSTFDKETKAYFTPKEEPLSPIVNTQEFYNDDYQCEERGGDEDGNVISEPLLQSPMDIKLFEELSNAQPSEELIKTIVHLAVPGKLGFVWGRVWEVGGLRG